MDIGKQLLGRCAIFSEKFVFFGTSAVVLDELAVIGILHFYHSWLACGAPCLDAE